MEYKLIISALAVFLTWSMPAAADDDVYGVIGMNPVGMTSYLAVFIPLGENDALTGVDWFNNDETAGFPEVMVSGGTLDGPGSVGDALVLGNDVYGRSSDWSRLSWNHGYSSHSGGVYVLFHLPVSSVYVGEGAGGGAAFGYGAGIDGLRGWLSADGEEWIGLHSDFGLAFNPITADTNYETVYLAHASKALGRSGLEDAHDNPSQPLKTELSAPFPNPFNPAAKLHFTLMSATHVSLVVYDLRGQLVRHLATKTFSAGEHVMTWHGRDESGREVGSGVYIARLRAGGIEQTQQLLLVR